MHTLSRKVVLIEGITNSGKTTATSILRGRMPGCTQIKFSDYYHKSVSRLLESELPAASKITPSIVDQITRFNLTRYTTVLRMITESPLDDYIIERLHLTDSVYRTFLFGASNQDQYKAVEELLNIVGTQVIMLTVDDNALRSRMESTLAARSRRYGANFEIPEHLLSYESNRRKRDLYLEVYQASKVKDKILIDTSLLTVQDLEKRLQELV